MKSVHEARSNEQARATATRTSPRSARPQQPRTDAGALQWLRDGGCSSAPQASPADAGYADIVEATHDTARAATRGPAEPLPYLRDIQASFGKHDVGGVAAHTGNDAAAGARAIGATAFTMGEHVAFAEPPTLNTAAHEAAHVIQQRAGVSLTGGMGQPGDHFERHADEVAARVVAGRSSEDLLDTVMAPAVRRSDSRPAVQRRPRPGGPRHVEVTIRYIDDSTELGHRLVAQISKATGIPEAALFQPMFTGAAEQIAYALGTSDAKSGARVKIAVDVSYDPERSPVATIERIAPTGAKAAPARPAKPPEPAEQPQPGETDEARLRRQARTLVRTLADDVAAADREGYAAIQITIEHNGRELLPGFQKVGPQTARPAGTLPMSAGEVAREHLAPQLDMILMGGAGRYELQFARNERGRFDFAKFRKVPPAPKDLADTELGLAYSEAVSSGDTQRAEAVDQEIERRSWGFGTAVVRGPEPMTGGRGAVTPAVALKLLDNMAAGQPPFLPEEGLGGCSWFTTEGNPYTSVTAAKSVNVEVEIAKGSRPLVFGEAELTQIFNDVTAATTAQAEAEYRAKFKIPDLTPLSRRAQKAIARVLPRFIEKQMWRRVGEIVASSSEKVGEVRLEPGGQFSTSPGRFAVVADASKITLKGGIGPVVDALAKEGVSAEPVVVEAAEALAKKMRWAGRVRGVFRYGGKVLIVIGVAQDLYKIYRAKDKLKATLTSAGGWAGATAAGAAFAAYFTPADAAGPVAWAVHGVGTLVSGAIGYWFGSSVTRYIYEITVE